MEIFAPNAAQQKPAHTVVTKTFAEEGWNEVARADEFFGSVNVNGNLAKQKLVTPQNILHNKHYNYSMTKSCKPTQIFSIPL